MDRRAGEEAFRDQLDWIFQLVPQFVDLSDSIIHNLQLRIDNWSVTEREREKEESERESRWFRSACARCREQNPRIADIIVKNGPFLKIYTEYFRVFDKQCRAMDEHRKANAAFDAVMAEFEADRVSLGLGIAHHLLRPVQRIPQYRLLLEQYRKTLPDDDPAYDEERRAADKALGIVSQVTQHLIRPVGHRPAAAEPRPSCCAPRSTST